MRSMALCLFSISSMALLFTSSIGMGQSNSETARREIIALGQGIYRFRDNKHFSIFIVGRKSVLMTDPINRDAAAWLRGEIRRRFGDLPVAYVVYSHNHWDHVSGGEVFADPGTRFIAHEMAASDLVRNNAPTRLPDLTFSDRMTIDFEGRAIELAYWGPNNGAGNISLFVPDARQLFVVDWIVLKRLPWREMYHYDLDGMISSIEEVLKLDFEKVAPGHSVVGTRADVEETLDYLRTLRQKVLDGMNDGRSLEELQRTIKLDRFSHFAMYDEWLPLNIKGAWNQLSQTSGRFGQDR